MPVIVLLSENMPVYVVSAFIVLLSDNMSVRVVSIIIVLLSDSMAVHVVSIPLYSSIDKDDECKENEFINGVCVCVCANVFENE